MNNIITSQLNGLMNKYFKEYERFSFKDNEFAHFEFSYQIYYKPLKQHILPAIMQQLQKDREDKYNNYEPFILEKYHKALLEDMKENKKVGKEFLKKLSVDITIDFNKLLISYKKMDEKLREHFLNQFIKNRTKAIIMIAQNDSLLALQTIAHLQCPRLQFYFVNKLPSEILHLMMGKINNVCDENFYAFLSESFFYPTEVEPADYYARWEGTKKIHIKFCRRLLGEKYAPAKEFLKAKAKFEKELSLKK